MPFAFELFFGQYFGQKSFDYKDVFKPIFLLNHTDMKTEWNFPQIIIGTCLYVS